MEKVEILIVGTNKPIMETIARLIDREEKWIATIAFSPLEAKAICLTKDFEMVLIGAGLNEQEENQLKTHLIALKPNLPIVKHYGGGSGLLFAEIYQCLNNR